MKKRIKNAILAVLTLATVVTCLPTTTFAKEQFKWSKSLTLEGKAYTAADGNAGGYHVVFFSDRDTDVVVKNYNGCLGTESDYTKTSGDPYTFGSYSAHKYYDYGYHFIEDKYQRKGKTYKAHVSRGFNKLVIGSCDDVKVKDGQTYKCRITSKDGNLIFLASGRTQNSKGVVNSVFPSKKTFKSFVKWVKPYDKDLCMWLARGESACDTVASFMSAYELSDKKYADLSKDIYKKVDAKVQKSKQKDGKFLSYYDAMMDYVKSVDGFEEALKTDMYDDTTGWDELNDTLQYYLVDFYK